MSRRAKWLAILLPVFAAIALSPYLLGERWGDYRTVSESRKETSQIADALKSQGKLVTGNESELLQSSLPDTVTQKDVDRYLSDLSDRYSYQLSDLTELTDLLDAPASVANDLKQQPFRAVVVGPTVERDALLEDLYGSQVRQDPLFANLLMIQNPNYLFTTTTSVSIFDNGSNTTRLEIDLAAWSAGS